MFRHVGLTEEDRALGIQAAGQEIQRHVQAILATCGGVGQRGHGVVIGNEVIRFALLLQVKGRAHHPEIIPEVQRAGGLDA